MAKRSKTTHGRSRPITSDEVVWGNVDEDDGGLSLVPLDPDEEKSRVRQRESMLTLGIAEEELDPTQADYPKPQFTIKHMVIAQAAVAVLLGLIRIFRPGMLAGSLGIAAMLMAAVISIFEPEDKRVTITFWCVMALYLTACVIALMLG